MDLIIQYSIIAVVFIVALIYMVKRFMPAKKKKGGCAKGCGCSMSESGSGGS
ncbi:FeoB-associated Cys-rich membrane protein [Sphingobacterium deserti]|uniref:FeoB-associated Cys-rich membrane protein n=1 Tax=Sphingobacterium deserti TaxID=1229276 RepID=A0A0B8SZI5_9SPHI|nr:FeoB-associated Cys-rich membrane protein [Sphingobacterium deserti]KGE12961.1 hypothetical protein DI53_3178 [Sphingobacterium deserti]